MKITKPELECVVKTLPIGYYAKRQIPLKVVEDGKPSRYSPVSDEIQISFPQVANAMKNAPDTVSKDTLIRSNLYHEISHAILTPIELSIRSFVNIFEDERIETVLKDYYLGVDFVANKYYTNGLDVWETPPAPESALEAFFQVVRYHIGKKEFLERTDTIIQKYAHLHRNSDYSTVRDYWEEIYELFHDVQQDFNTENPDKADSENMDDWDDDSDSEGEGESDSSDEESKEGKEKEGKNKEGKGKEDKKEVEAKKALESKEHGLNKKQVKAAIAEALNSFSVPAFNKEVYDTLTLVLESFRKKCGGGNAIQGYSGVLNPRNATRKDYRIFDRSTTARSGNSFGSLHLNLFIDKSGSFRWSQNTVNRLLNTLTSVESKYSNFSLDVVFMDDEITVTHSKEERVLHCGGGNDIPDEMFSVYRSLQKPNTFNYNIVLFDGDAFSDCYTDREELLTKNNFRAFDYNNCTIISDRDNEDYIKAVVKKARVIYTENYSDELIKNVCQVMTSAFH